MSPRKRAAKLLNLPPNIWRQAIEQARIPDEEWRDVAIELSRVVQSGAMLADYINCRKGFYAGQYRDHKTSVKESNKTLVKVRRAMGYSVPEAGTVNI